MCDKLFSIPREDRTRANSLQLHKGSLSNYLGCVTQKQLPKRAWEIRPLRRAEQNVSANGSVKVFPAHWLSDTSLCLVGYQAPPDSTSWPGSSSSHFHSMILGSVTQSQMRELDS